MMPELETKITGKELRTITVFYTDPPESWDELFKQAAARYGLSRDNKMIRFIAVPANCGLK